MKQKVECNALRFGTRWNGWNAVERLERCGTRIFSRFLTFGETKGDNNALRFGTLWNGWNAVERLTVNAEKKRVEKWDRAASDP